MSCNFVVQIVKTANLYKNGVAFKGLGEKSCKIKNGSHEMDFIINMKWLLPLLHNFFHPGLEDNTFFFSLVFLHGCCILNIPKPSLNWHMCLQLKD